MANQNVLPLPGSLASMSCPPIDSTSFLEIVNPSPVPPYRREVELSACWKASKMMACLSGGMPMPVSDTANFSWFAEWDTCKVTVPREVNLMALPSRLTSTCRRRPWSADTHSGVESSTTLFSSSLFRDASRFRIEAMSAIKGRRANATRNDFHPSGLHLGKVEDVVNQIEQSLGGEMDILEVFDHLRLCGHLESEVSKPNHGVQRRPHLVADVGHKLAFDAAGLLGPRPGGGQIAGALFHRDLEFGANLPLAEPPAAATIAR